MKYFHFFLRLAIYVGTIYLCLYIYSSFAAYSNYKSEEIKNVKIKEADKNWISGGTPTEGNGVAKALFGDVLISFPLHCFPTAQSYFNSTVSFTSSFAIIFLVPGSIILPIILKFKKFRFQLIHIILTGIVVSVVSFVIMQGWLSSRKQSSSDKLLKAVQPICF